MTADFTIERYRDVASAAVRRFRFLTFDAQPAGDGVALWRHDIDFSPQRAVALARIERELGLVAIYFVQVSSRFYSVFEPETATLLREIAATGHHIGLHFDPAGVAENGMSGRLAQRLVFEAGVLGQLLETPVRAFSLHNPTTFGGGAFDEPACAGLINASHPGLRASFTYCSDSNGVWRHRQLADVVADPAVQRLYALTHPEWWQETAMPPRQRIQRCIDGRAASAAQYYDDLLQRHGRPNLA